MKALFLVLLCVLLACAQAGKAPQWPQQYYVDVLFDIPYFNLTEPLELWYDGVNNRQVFSYYDGMDVYNWRFDLGMLFAVVPQVDKLGCISSNVSGSPMVSLLPDLTNWTMLAETTKDGNTFQVWEWSYTMYNLTQTSQLVLNNGVPEMLTLKGEDWIFGSHPDIYTITYLNYVPNFYNESVFEVSEVCDDAKDNYRTGERAKALISRFIGINPPRNLDDEFERYRLRHKKMYFLDGEYEMRKDTYFRNKKFIEEHNKRTDVGFTVAMNKFGDMTTEEVSTILMPKPAVSRRELAKTANKYHELQGNVPASINWVDLGAVNAPKDQGVCGSCWTFGTAGSIEGAWFLATGELPKLSEQQIVDCVWVEWSENITTQGCDGGFAPPAMQWVIDNGGMATEGAYPYLMQDGWCKMSDKSSGVQLSGYVNVTEFDEDALMDAVANAGPVAIAIDAAFPEFVFYSSGVYYNPACLSGLDDLDHEVLVVGYGSTEAGDDYWLVKNSWSVIWGQGGFIKMARDQGNNCGIASNPTYPIVRVSN